MHVVLWETPSGTVAYGPFPEGRDAQEWLFPLEFYLGPEVQASTLLVGPAYDYRNGDLPLSEFGDGWVVNTRALSDRWAFGFIVCILSCDQPRAGAGVFVARAAAAAWWKAQARALSEVHDLVWAQVVPLLPVPVNPEAFTALSDQGEQAPGTVPKQ